MITNNARASLVLALADLNEFDAASERMLNKTGPIHQRVLTGCANQLEAFESRLERLVSQERAELDFEALEKAAEAEIARRNLARKKLLAERKRRALEREAEIEFYRQLELEAA